MWSSLDVQHCRIGLVVLVTFGWSQTIFRGWTHRKPLKLPFKLNILQVACLSVHRFFGWVVNQNLKDLEEPLHDLQITAVTVASLRLVASFGLVDAVVAGLLCCFVCLNCWLMLCVLLAVLRPDGCHAVCLPLYIDFVVNTFVVDAAKGGGQKSSDDSSAQVPACFSTVLMTRHGYEQTSCWYCLFFSVLHCVANGLDV